MISLIVGIVSTSFVENVKRFPLDDFFNDIKIINWFGVTLYTDFFDSPDGVSSLIHIKGPQIVNIVLVAVLYLFLFAFPFILHAIHKKACKNTSLNVTDSQICGSYNSFLSKKNLQIPIEKIDNLTTKNSFFDKLRSGATLGICSASRIIKIHFVQNPDEVISIAMKRIEEIKKSDKNIVVQSLASIDEQSVSEKLKELAQMKEQALITEDEYNKKREEIIAKM